MSVAWGLSLRAGSSPLCSPPRALKSSITHSFARFVVRTREHFMGLTIVFFLSARYKQWDQRLFETARAEPANGATTTNAAATNEAADESDDGSECNADDGNG